MPLTNKQYDAIMRLYDRRQYQDYRRQRACQEEVYARLPQVRALEESISEKSLRHAEQIYGPFDDAAFNGSDPDKVLADLRTELQTLRKEKEALLQKAGYPADYLDMHYVCPDCQDTGYIGRKKCHCFKREEIRLLYSSSRLEAVLAEENFSTLSFDVYDEEQRKIMPAIIHTCEDFVDTFSKTFRNLHFYGPVGTGKTFLSNCIARELLEQGYSVIYFTAFQFFELFSPGSYGSARTSGEQDSLLESDLLILDDMGTELANTFTVSRLFQILNERTLRRKSTILSTNLSPKDFRDIYSERVFSRITSSYTLVKFSGSDIRIRKKISGSH